MLGLILFNIYAADLPKTKHYRVSICCKQKTAWQNGSSLIHKKKKTPNRKSQESRKYFGITFRTHLKELERKANYVFCKLYVPTGMQKHKIQNKFRIAKSIFISMLLYGCEIWTIANVILKKKIQVSINRITTYCNHCRLTHLQRTNRNRNKYKPSNQNQQRKWTSIIYNIVNWHYRWY